VSILLISASHGITLIAVRRPHLAHEDRDDLHLRVGCLGVGREEDDEIAVLVLRHQEVLGSAFLVERIAGRKVGFGFVIAAGIGPDQGLKRQSRVDELALLEKLFPILKQGLIRRDDAVLQFRSLLAATRQHPGQHKNNKYTFQKESHRLPPRPGKPDLRWGSGPIRLPRVPASDFFHLAHRFRRSFAGLEDGGTRNDHVRAGSKNLAQVAGIDTAIYLEPGSMVI
jgi:hypothetical protein